MSSTARFQGHLKFRRTRDLFAPPKIIKNRAMDTLTKAKFILSGRYWQELQPLDPDNGFSDATLDICRFRNGLYPEGDLLNQAGPLEICTTWRGTSTEAVMRIYPSGAQRTGCNRASRGRAHRQTRQLLERPLIVACFGEFRSHKGNQL